MRQTFRPSAVAAVCSFASAWLLAPATPAFAQVQISTRAMELEFSGRVQFEAQTSSCTDATPGADSACSSEAPALDMFLRRARFSLEATIDERLALKIEPDFAGIDEVSMKDVWGRYTFGPGLAIQAGHFKRPFDGFHMTSSSQLPFERDVEIPGVEDDVLPSYSGLTTAFDLADRDVGMTLEGTPGDGPFTWWIGVFTGGSDSRAADTNSEKQFIGRGRIALDPAGVPVLVAGAVAFTDAPYVTSDGETEGEYFTNFELFAELGAWDRDGLLVHAGLVAGDNPRRDDLGLPVDPESGDFGSLLTWQAVSAYRLPVGATWLEAVAPLLRISYADPTDADEDAAWGFTPGLTLYFADRNRLALTWDVASFEAEGVDTESSFTAQMQFYF